APRRDPAGSPTRTFPAPPSAASHPSNACAQSSPRPRIRPPSWPTHRATAAPPGSTLPAHARPPQCASRSEKCRSTIVTCSHHRSDGPASCCPARRPQFQSRDSKSLRSRSCSSACRCPSARYAMGNVRLASPRSLHPPPAQSTSPSPPSASPNPCSPAPRLFSAHRMRESVPAASSRARYRNESANAPSARHNNDHWEHQSSPCCLIPCVSALSLPATLWRPRSLPEIPCSGNPAAATHSIYRAHIGYCGNRLHAAVTSITSRRPCKPPFARSPPSSQTSPERGYPQEPAVSCTALALSDRHVLGNVRVTIFSADLEFR